MKTSTIIWIVVVLIIIVGGIWWLSSRNTNAMPATQAATTTAPTVSLGSTSQFPAFLTAASGMTLYTFKSDTTGVSNCTGSCATEWPPYTVTSAAGLSAGANIPGTLGTITRSDGTLQVTYNGMPLYFWIHDTKPGDVTGNGQDNFSVAMTSQAATQAPQAPQATRAPQATPVVRTVTPPPAPASAPVTPVSTSGSGY